MRRLLIASLVATTVLAACDRGGDETDTNVEVAGPDNARNAIEAMPEGQRNAVFIRAIQDAGQQCQHVESSERAGEHQGFPVWNATCQGGGTWTIVIMNDGNAAVLNAAEGRLVDVNETAPAQNAQ